MDPLKRQRVESLLVEWLRYGNDLGLGPFYRDRAPLVAVASAAAAASATAAPPVAVTTSYVEETVDMSPSRAPARVVAASAPPVVASWQVVMSGLLMGLGLAVLGLGGALLAGAKTSPFSIIFSISGFIAFALVAQYIARHPESIEGIGVTLLRWINHLRNKPENHGVKRWHEILVQLRAVKLKPKETSIAFGWSLFNWIAD